MISPPNRSNAKLAAAKIVSRRKALEKMKKRYEDAIAKIEKQLERPANVQLELPKEVVKVEVEAPEVRVDAPQVSVTVPENAIQVKVESEAPTVNTPVQVVIPENAIQVHVHVKADAPVIPPPAPPAINFSPRIPEPKTPPQRKTSYRFIRHEYTNEILGVEATDN